MRDTKRKRLETKGWRIGDAKDFLGLSPQEALLIDLKIHLGHSLRGLRTQRKLTQLELARLLRSSQSRVAKMEAGDPSVSLDLLVRALMSLGASNKDIAKTIAKAA